MAGPFTPLLDPGKEQYDNPSFMNTPGDIAAAQQSFTPQKTTVSPIIPKELAPDTIESRLKAEGSGTSTLSMILAIAGAAKGDFRGLQAIEESKRRTSLAKSMIPEMTKVNAMITGGKWEEASSYVNELAGSYGSRADYLVPYFQQMQADIKKKQEGWKNLEFLYKSMKGKVPEDHPNYDVFQAIEQAVKDRDQPSETTLQGFMTRYASPHTQILNNAAIQQSLLTGKISRQVLPQTYQDKDFDNYIGTKTAFAVGTTPAGLADLFNDRPIKLKDGTTIEPNSREAQLVKAHYIEQQPIEARLKMVQGITLEPALVAQLLSQGETPESIKLMEFGKGGEKVGGALEGQAERLKRQTIATREGLLEVEPVTGPVLNTDPNDPAYLSEIIRPVTSKEIKESGGKIGKPQPETVAMIRKTQQAINGLDEAAKMLKEGITLQTRGDRLSAGAIQTLSRFINYPITDKVETRQLIKSMLNTAIEQIENTAIASPGQIRGGDREDIAKLKAFAAGDFKGEKAVLQSIERTRARLSNMTNMVINQPGATPRATSPASTIAPLIPQKGSQITRPPYTQQGDISIPADVDEDIKRRIADSVRKGEKGGAIRVEVPTAYSEEDEAAKAMARRQQRRR